MSRVLHSCATSYRLIDLDIATNTDISEIQYCSRDFKLELGHQRAGSISGGAGELSIASYCS